MDEYCVGAECVWILTVLAPFSSLPSLLRHVDPVVQF
jgi:hypothetical protein